MNLDQQYSKYFGANNLSPKNYAKNAAYLDLNREQDNMYPNQNWNRPLSNQNPHGASKKELFTLNNRKYNQDTKLSSHLPANNQLHSKYYYGGRQQLNYQDQQTYFRGKGIGLTNKYRPSSNDKAVQRQQVDARDMVLKNSQSQGQLLKRNYEKLRDQKPISPSLSGRKLPQHHQRAQLSQYKKLYDKLDSLQNKLAAMKVNLEKKKAQKQIAIEKNQKQRKQKQLQKQKRMSQKSQPKDPKTHNSKEGSDNILKGIVTQVPKMNKQLHSFDHNPYSPRHNMYYVSEITRAYKEEKSIAREHLLTSMQLLKIMEASKKAASGQYNGKVLNLSKKACYKDKKTVVFDLDETLIHCNQTTSTPYDVALPITFPTGQVIQAGINIRPHAQEVLKALAANFEVIIFTASHSCYANVVLDYLDPTKTLIQHRLYREHCHVTSQGMHVKDLRVINRKPTDMVLVDNAAYSYAFQLDNGIPIIPYYEGKNDYELKALQTYLERLIWVPDVQQVNKKVFKLHEYKNFEDPETLVQQLYTEWIV